MKKFTALTALLSMALLPSLVHPLPASAQRGRNRNNGSVTWNGRVDDVMDIYFQQGRSWTKRVSGKPGTGDARFSEDLPQRNLDLSLRKTEGRGRVSLRQRPNRRNAFTAIVRVVDHQDAMGNYAFTLRWND